MTTKNHETIDVNHEDELIVHHLLSEMIQNERWELTELGRQAPAGWQREPPTPAPSGHLAVRQAGRA